MRVRRRPGRGGDVKRPVDRDDGRGPAARVAGLATAAGQDREAQRVGQSRTNAASFPASSSRPASSKAVAKPTVAWRSVPSSRPVKRADAPQLDDCAVEVAGAAQDLGPQREGRRRVPVVVARCASRCTSASSSRCSRAAASAALNESTPSSRRTGEAGARGGQRIVEPAVFEQPVRAASEIRGVGERRVELRAAEAFALAAVAGGGVDAVEEAQHVPVTGFESERAQRERLGIAEPFVARGLGGRIQQRGVDVVGHRVAALLDPFERFGEAPAPHQVVHVLDEARVLRRARRPRGTAARRRRTGRPARTPTR